MPQQSARHGVAMRMATGQADVIDLHLRLGSDPCREMVVWWSTSARVRAPQVLIGAPHTGYNRVVPAATLTYHDAAAGAARYLHHATLTRLCPGARYIFLAAHNGVAMLAGEFRTSPRTAGCETTGGAMAPLDAAPPLEGAIPTVG